MTDIHLANFKDKLRHSTCTGLFSKTTDSAFVEAAGIAGLDFIILDSEHGPASWETLHHHVRAASLTTMVPIIRVKGVDAHSIGSAFDTGAAGVQVPNISTAEEAGLAVKAARFHPDGNRGVCRFVRAAQFGEQEKSSYFKTANEKLLILQIEGLEGIRNLDAILDVKGFDVLFIGPYDLSQSVGKTGQVDAPEVIALMREIADKAKAKGVLLGAFSDSPARNVSLCNEGFSYIAYSVDIAIFATACAAIRDF
ncbi:MAG: aldolase/citrate lyase family protein [Methylovulum sp.]|uniref:HpcH/HpaI aldolase family protein n=1 Tax=Methylovulum sp. TaxID=1916980 RepID=UPI00262B8076|nr:aldolase/citrate lyase family protein [Methylovulum sp.]MDD2725033.1 aldolase/citrate lyase family protein [Methylovulum sp.]MDD5124244.1 aldolase/citrate lyase family protein [Methylovulum sp.]